MQEYRSGHNEAVLKTVCPKGTGVRIPLPAPKIRTLRVGCPLFFVLGMRGFWRPSAQQNGVRIKANAAGELAQMLQSRQSSPMANTPHRVFPYKCKTPHVGKSPTHSGGIFCLQIKRPDVCLSVIF